MRTEDLKNTKIYLPYFEDKLEFKKKVVKLGVKWDFHHCDDPLFSDIPFIYLDEDLELYVHGEKEIKSFCLSRNKQIFLDEVLSIKEPKEGYQFKPFDRVLVRNTEDDKWRPREYASLDASDKFGLAYGTTDGCYRKYCIPYKGNEELANTTKSPEQ